MNSIFSILTKPIELAHEVIKAQQKEIAKLRKENTELKNQVLKLKKKKRWCLFK